MQKKFVIQLVTGVYDTHSAEGGVYHKEYHDIDEAFSSKPGTFDLFGEAEKMIDVLLTLHPGDTFRIDTRYVR